jgi:hypothetical protein
VHRSMGVAADESERQDHDEAAGEQRSHKRRGLRVVLDYLRGVPRLRHSTDHGQRLGGRAGWWLTLKMGDERLLTAAPLLLPLDFA